MVEQFRVAGVLSRATEIVGGRNQPVAEKMEPDAVGLDAGSERIGRCREPVRQFKTSTGIGRKTDRLRGIEHGHEAARHQGAVLGDFAVLEQRALGDPPVLDTHRAWPFPDGGNGTPAGPVHNGVRGWDDRKQRHIA